MKYLVTNGSLAKENGYWNSNGMVEKDYYKFDDIEQAKAMFESIDPEDQFKTEWGCATVKPRNKGYYVELVEVDKWGEDQPESIDWKQYTADDYLKDQS